MDGEEKLSKWQLEVMKGTAFWDEVPEESNSSSEETIVEPSEHKKGKRKSSNKKQNKKVTKGKDSSQQKTNEIPQEKKNQRSSSTLVAANAQCEKNIETTKNDRQECGTSESKSLVAYEPPLPEVVDYASEFLEIFGHLLSEEDKEEIIKEVQGVGGELDKEDKLKNHRKRQKELFKGSGLVAWPDHHILEFLLFFTVPRKDTRDLGRTLLTQFHSIRGVLDAPYEALLQIKGIGPHSALHIKFIAAFQARVLESQSTMKILSTQDAYETLFPHFMNSTVESSKVMCLDGDRNLIAIRDLGEGNIYSTPTDIRRIVQSAMNTQAVYLYLVHNHIGSPFVPSAQDWIVTEEISKIMYPLQLHLMDHIIIGKNHGEMTSLRAMHTSPKYQIRWGAEVKKPPS